MIVVYNRIKMSVVFKLSVVFKGLKMRVVYKGLRMNIVYNVGFIIQDCHQEPQK